MELTTLDIGGHKGPVPNAFFKQPDTDHLALIYPGWGYTCQMPLLHYAASLLEQLGADVLRVNYAYNKIAGFRELSDEEQYRWLFSDADAAYYAAKTQRTYRRVTLVGKSLGTHALAHLLSEESELHDASAVWLTPLLNDADFRKRLARCPQRSLFVIGTADLTYNMEQLEALKRTSNYEVEEIENADHSLEIPGDVNASLKALQRVLTRIQTFLEETP